jgi:hypothetical protein
MKLRHFAPVAAGGAFVVPFHFRFFDGFTLGFDNFSDQVLLHQSPTKCEKLKRMGITVIESGYLASEL